jgi:hypothetical protein
MDWNWLPNREGFTGVGREDVYLVAADMVGGMVTRVWLTRWRTQPMSLSIALEASRNVITFPFTTPQSVVSLEVAILLDSAKCFADDYEAGKPLEGHPAWQQPSARRPDQEGEPV